ncbi:MAG TPA: inositol monophosphatase [Oleiagrimonas sp.]|nr:inositol monophosphatase [Oleiagrimonas sp.]
MVTIDDQWLDAALAVAREAAAAGADAIARHHPDAVDVEYKADASPVTVADREAETAIRGVIARHYPDHAVFGEEQGREGEGDFLWLVDPLDGTKSFVRGTPFYSTQIALMHKGELLLGVSAAPHYGETLWARRGGGAWRNGKRIHVADTKRERDAVLSVGNIQSLAGNALMWRELGDLIGEVNRIRGYGDFCHYHLLARGALDIVIESNVNILDIAALAVIVREAGGVFTDLHGMPLSLETRSVLATVPELYDPVCWRFQSETECC